MKKQETGENQQENPIGEKQGLWQEGREESLPGEEDWPGWPSPGPEKKPKAPGSRKRGSVVFFHFLQHISLVMAAVMITAVFSGSYLVVDTRKGPMSYNLVGEDQGRPFEESDLFNTLLGNSVSDIICYGAIRGQMETDGKFDPGKTVDVAAFAGRYGGIPQEYITADYYLDDLIKWAQAGFGYEEAYMDGEEAARFLGRSTMVTRVDKEKLESGTGGYLNSDLSGARKVVTVSGNQIDGGNQVTLLLNKYRTAEGKNIENYVSSWEEYYELCGNVRKAAEDLSINYDEYLKYRDYYDSGNSNIVYFIRRAIGGQEQVFTNMETGLSSVTGLKKELSSRCGKYIFYDAQSMEFETNTLIEEMTLRYILSGFDYAYPGDTQVMIGVDARYGSQAGAQDCFAQAKAGFGNYVPYVWQYLLSAIVCLLVYLLLLMLLTIWEGRNVRRTPQGIVKGFHREDSVPTEAMAFAACAVCFGLVWGTGKAVGTFWHFGDKGVMVILAAAISLLSSLCFSFFYYSFVRRLKVKTLWRDSLARRMGIWGKKWILYGYDHSALIVRVWGPYVLFLAVNGLGIAFAAYTIYDGTSWGWGVVGILVILAADAGAGYALYRSALAKQMILEGIRLINEGDLSHKVKEEGLHGEDLILARAVNSIGDSVRVAVETSMKDERMKADLITNVSHDIKTPLTSIINYVDLIKRENVSHPKVREYIEVLDAKSQRLKQLTDDLVEASKISSGNIVYQWEKIDLVELLHQTVGEFSEKFEEKSLYLVFQVPKGNVYIEADSRRIWRVIENLFNNIIKYALPGTRVYLDMEFAQSQDKQRWVALSIKNISAQPLKVNPQELTERFIRGDESRTTEGSGLGLSIAKNLTEALKGEFEIVMDGDLFKVNLAFPLMDEVNNPS